MLEQRRELKVFKVSCQCESCNSGNLIFQPPNTANPLPFRHVCDSCGEEKILPNMTYPKVEYQEL